jgi:hypothetical protein
MAGDTLPINGYLSTDVLLVIYTHSFLDTISQPQIDKIISEVQQAREFYARNSRFRFNINIADVAIIDRLLTLEQFEKRPSGRYVFPWWEVDGVHSVRNDLYYRGYTDGQFASVFVYYAWVDRDTIRAPGGAAYALSQSFLDYTAYAIVPYKHDPENSDYLFIHEFHHNLDQMFDASGLPEYPFADRPQDYNSGVFDDGRTFNAWMLREWPRDNWALMSLRWGMVMTYEDEDNDGFPDLEPGIAIDETRFGSSISTTDSDFDNLSDIDELIAGHSSSTDPNITDTDGDGFSDGDDPYPLDPVEPYLYRGEMVVDGMLDSATAPFLVSFGLEDTADLPVDLYGCYADTGIYLCFDVKDDSVFYGGGLIWSDGVRLRLDAQSDGHWHHGNDNYDIYVLPQGNEFDPERRIDISLDDGTHSLDYIPSSDLRAAYSRTESGYCVEMFIRENPLTAFRVEDATSVRIQCDVMDPN